MYYKLKYMISFLKDAPDFESTVSVSVRSDCMLSGTHPKSSPNEVSDQGNMQPSSVLDELRSLELSIDEDAPNSDHREGVNEQASTNRSERSMLSTTRMQASLEQIKESELPIKDEDLEQIPKTKTLQANPMQHSGIVQIYMQYFTPKFFQTVFQC